jgi:hypothetical protein
MDVARHGQISPGVHEFHFVLMTHHMINDARAILQTINRIFELLGGSATPGGVPRTDAELAKVLDHEWMQRWGAPREAHNGIVPATEVRILGLARSKFREAAWKVDNRNMQKRFIVRETYNLSVILIFTNLSGWTSFPSHQKPRPESTSHPNEVRRIPDCRHIRQVQSEARHLSKRRLWPL